VQLNYALARWQDPQTGRFTSLDPARDGVNWYVYCGNNPITYIDPTGLDANSYGEYFNYNAGNLEAANRGNYNPNDPAGVTSNMTDYGWAVYKNNILVRTFINVLVAKGTNDEGKLNEAKLALEKVVKIFGLDKRTDVGMLMLRGIDNILKGDDKACEREIVLFIARVEGIKEIKNLSSVIVNDIGKGIAYLGDKIAAANEKAAAGKDAVGAPGRVATPYGDAVQALTKEALAARAKVEGGATLYRIGTTGKSAAGGAQFWSLENPLSPGYASRYGLPAENITNANFIETATLKPGASFITRPAPGIGTNLGGGMEVVVSPGGVNVQTFVTIP
jgi:hypothetical protein